MKTVFNLILVRISRNLVSRTMSTTVQPLQKSEYVNGSNTFLDPSSKIYELRTYACHPKDYRDYLKLTDERINLRTKHSKLLGFWTTELGGLNEVVHIWEYDSYEHRTKVRQALLVDRDWQEKYISKAAPSWMKQENSTLVPFNWSQIQTPTTTGVYELQTFVMNSQPDLWEARLRTAIDSSVSSLAPLNSLLIGVFFTIFGQQNSVVALWQHENFDKSSEGKIRLLKECNRSAMHAFYHEVLMSHSKGLQPHKCSPLQ